MDKKQFYKNIPSLETSRLILRKMKLDDLDDIFEYASEKKLQNIYVGIRIQRNNLLNSILRMC